MKPQRALLLCRSIPTKIFIVVLRRVTGLGVSFLSHLKLLTRLPDNHVSLKRQLTLNALKFWPFSPLKEEVTVRASVVLTILYLSMD